MHILTLFFVLFDPTIDGIETPDVVAQWVASDLATVNPIDQPFQRYVWVPSWSDPKTPHALTFAVNAAASRSGIIQQPTMLANGWLQRWDLRRLVQTDEELANLIKVWDSLIVDEPYFHDRQTATISPAVALRLATLGPVGEMGCPVYRGDWFLSKLLGTIDGGKYIEFRGLRATGKDGRTQEQLALARLGVFEDASVEVDGDRRVGMFRSGVTGKARSVIALRSLIGWAWVTEDIFDEDVDADTHPIYNLMNNNYRGREIIATLPNGLHAFLITDDKGNILDEAPPQLVADHMIPAPYTKRLQGGAISCIRCHGIGDGLRDCRNDVASLLSNNLTPLDDLTLPDGVNSYDEIATRYSGRAFERSLIFGRQDYADAIRQVSGGLLTTQQMSQLVTDVYGGFHYDMVDSEVALRELGFNLNDPDNKIQPSVVFSQMVDFPDAANGIALEDPSIAALFSGIPIRRTDFERVYGQLLFRSIQMRNKK